MEQKRVNLFKLILALACLGIGNFVSWDYAYANTLNSFRNTPKEPITSFRCNQFTFDATESFIPENENISVFWNFGDGQTSIEPVVTHTYQKAGDYTVTLSLTDNSGLESNKRVSTQTVRVNIPPHAEFSSPDRVCANQPMLLDAGGSYDDSQEKLGYEWNFGDGTSAYQKKRVEKIYTKGGDYKVSLTVDDNSQTVCSKQTVDKIVHVNEPPLAQAGDDVIFKCVSEDSDLVVAFDAAKSSDANNDPLAYLWDFDDGTKGNGTQVSHQYSQTGNYDVKLIVHDNTNMGCGIGVDFVMVKLNRAPQADAGEDVISCIGQEVVFDGTNSHANIKGTLSAKWYFGDGQSAHGLKVSHRYDKPGTYQAILAVANELNPMCPDSRDTRLAKVNAAPLISIKSVSSACSGEQVLFDASSAIDPDGDALGYYWSFGDGTVTRAGPKVTHRYKEGGDYRVSVIVDDGKATPCSSATAKANIKVNTPPVADAGPNLACCDDVATAFSADTSFDPDGDKLTYIWYFGDGLTARGIKVNHTYAKAGSYNVSLTVDDNSGTSCSRSTAGFVAKVKSVPVPVIKVR